jgi:hypothetical protein
MTAGNILPKVLRLLPLPEATPPASAEIRLLRLLTFSLICFIWRMARFSRVIASPVVPTILKPGRRAWWDEAGLILPPPPSLLLLVLLLMRGLL